MAALYAAVDVPLLPLRALSACLTPEGCGGASFLAFFRSLSWASFCFSRLLCLVALSLACWAWSSCWRILSSLALRFLASSSAMRCFCFSCCSRLACSASFLAFSTTFCWLRVSGCSGGAGKVSIGGTSGFCCSISGLDGFGGGGVDFFDSVLIGGSGAAVTPTSRASITGPFSATGRLQVMGLSASRPSDANTRSHVVHDIVVKSRNPAMPTCSNADHRTARGVRLLSSILRRIRRGGRRAHQAHVRHTGMLQHDQHLHDAAVIDALVAADQHRNLRILVDERTHLTHQLLGVDGLARRGAQGEIDLAVLVDADQHRLLVVLERLGGRLRQFDVHAQVQQRRGHHENDQQHQHHVDVGHDVDLRLEAALAAAMSRRSSHHGPRQALSPALTWRSRIEENSSWKLS